MAFPENATWLLFGKPKAGKTTSASTFPDPLFLETEPEGADWIDAYKIQIENLEQLREAWTELARKVKGKEELPYKTVVLDTIDSISNWVESEVAAQYGAKQLGESKVFGADFGTHRNEVLRIIRRFGQLPLTTVLICHSKAISEAGTDVKVLELPGRLGRMIMGEVSHVIYVEAKELPSGEMQRRFIFQPSGIMEAGSRHPTLTNAGSCKANYEALRALFKGEGKKPGTARKTSFQPSESRDAGDIVSST